MREVPRDYEGCQKTFGHSFKSNCYEWEIEFVSADVPLSAAANEWIPVETTRRGRFQMCNLSLICATYALGSSQSLRVAAVSGRDAHVFH